MSFTNTHIIWENQSLILGWNNFLVRLYLPCDQTLNYYYHFLLIILLSSMKCHKSLLERSKVQGTKQIQTNLRYFIDDNSNTIIRNKIKINCTTRNMKQRCSCQSMNTTVCLLPSKNNYKITMI
jgi:hypothetical protein